MFFESLGVALHALGISARSMVLLPPHPAHVALPVTGCHQPVGSGCWKGSLIGVQKLGELLDTLATGTPAHEVARLNTNTH